MKDFFVSYTAADERWAEWISWTLEEAKFTVVVQKWDFLAGSNFALEMHRAAESAKRTIAVLSPAYLNESKFGSPEWAAAFAKDPDAILRTLVPVRVKPCEITGLLKPIVYVDFVGVDEATCRKRLLDHIRGGRLKPTERPAFPGESAGDESKPAFPAEPSREPPKSTRYMPRIAGRITDQDRRRFIRDAFEHIRESFKASLAELRDHNPGVDFDFVPTDANSFTAEIYVNGTSSSQCRIWIGGMLGGGNDIAYFEGRFNYGSNSMNEDLSIAEADGELFLSAMMGMSFGNFEGLNLKRLSIQDAADYFWRRFASSLER
jgi:hypothetical protein